MWIYTQRFQNKCLLCLKIYVFSFHSFFIACSHEFLWNSCYSLFKCFLHGFLLSLAKVIRSFPQLIARCVYSTPHVLSSHPCRNSARWLFFHIARRMVSWSAARTRLTFFSFTSANPSANSVTGLPSKSVLDGTWRKMYGINELLPELPWGPRGADLYDFFVNLIGCVFPFM